MSSIVAPDLDAIMVFFYGFCMTELVSLSQLSKSSPTAKHDMCRVATGPRRGLHVVFLGLVPGSAPAGASGDAAEPAGDAFCADVEAREVIRVPLKHLCCVSSGQPRAPPPDADETKTESADGADPDGANTVFSAPSASTLRLLVLVGSSAPGCFRLCSFVREATKEPAPEVAGGGGEGAGAAPAPADAAAPPPLRLVSCIPIERKGVPAGPNTLAFHAASRTAVLGWKGSGAHDDATASSDGTLLVLAVAVGDDGGLEAPSELWCAPTDGASEGSADDAGGTSLLVAHAAGLSGAAHPHIPEVESLVVATSGGSMCVLASAAGRGDTARSGQPLAVAATARIASSSMSPIVDLAAACAQPSSTCDHGNAPGLVVCAARGSGEVVVATFSCAVCEQSHADPSADAEDATAARNGGEAAVHAQTGASDPALDTRGPLDVSQLDNLLKVTQLCALPARVVAAPPLPKDGSAQPAAGVAALPKHASGSGCRVVYDVGSTRDAEADARPATGQQPLVWDVDLGAGAMVGQLALRVLARPSKPLQLAADVPTLVWDGVSTGLAYPAPPTSCVGAMPTAVSLWVKPNWEVPPTPAANSGPGPGDGGQVLFVSPRRLAAGGSRATVRFHVYPRHSGGATAAFVPGPSDCITLFKVGASEADIASSVHTVRVTRHHCVVGAVTLPAAAVPSEPGPYMIRYTSSHGDVLGQAEIAVGACELPVAKLYPLFSWRRFSGDAPRQDASSGENVRPSPRVDELEVLCSHDGRVYATVGVSTGPGADKAVDPELAAAPRRRVSLRFATLPPRNDAGSRVGRLHDGQWTHVAVTLSHEAGVQVLLDGQPYGATTCWPAGVAVGDKPAADGATGEAFTAAGAGAQPPSSYAADDDLLLDDEDEDEFDEAFAGSFDDDTHGAVDGAVDGATSSGTSDAEDSVEAAPTSSGEANTADRVHNGDGRVLFGCDLRGAFFRGSIAGVRLWAGAGRRLDADFVSCGVGPSLPRKGPLLRETVSPRVVCGTPRATTRRTVPLLDARVRQRSGAGARGSRGRGRGCASRRRAGCRRRGCLGATWRPCNKRQQWPCGDVRPPVPVAAVRVRSCARLGPGCYVSMACWRGSSADARGVGACERDERHSRRSMRRCTSPDA